MIEIFSTSFSEPLSDAIWHEYLQQLPESIQDRAGKYYRWQDRHSFLFGRLLLLKGLLRCGYDSRILENLLKTSCGKPYIDESLDFNISHSGNRVVCALSRTFRVGIDIESVRDIDFNGFQNCFTKKEWDQILESQDQQRSFFKTWTRKESILKADGRGLFIPLQEICVVADTVSCDNELWYLHDVSADIDYPCCLATNNPQAEIKRTPVIF